MCVPSTNFKLYESFYNYLVSLYFCQISLELFILFSLLYLSCLASHFQHAIETKKNLPIVSITLSTHKVLAFINKYWSNYFYFVYITFSAIFAIIDGLYWIYPLFSIYVLPIQIKTYPFYPQLFQLVKYLLSSTNIASTILILST